MVEQAYDEAFLDNGKPRPHYEAVLAAFDDPAALAAQVKDRLRARGVSFGGAADGIFALDPVSSRPPSGRSCRSAWPSGCGRSMRS